MNVTSSIEVESDEFVASDESFWTTSTVAGGMEIVRLMVDEDLGRDFASERKSR